MQARKATVEALSANIALDCANQELDP